jgi:hypothetical protein
MIAPPQTASKPIKRTPQSSPAMARPLEKSRLVDLGLHLLARGEMDMVFILTRILHERRLAHE